MAGEALAAFMRIQMMQSVFQSFESSTQFGSFLCPRDAPIQNISSLDVDYIIVGAGAAGSVLASRLTADPRARVLLLEAGGCPPFMGEFAFVPRTEYDYNLPSVDDNYALQNLQGEAGGITIGRMLGGTSCLHHGLRVVGDQLSYERWAEAANDSSWRYDNFLQYFKVQEKLEDERILAKYRPYHGTEGNIVTKRQISSANCGIFDAYCELGYKERIDTNNADPLGVTEPLLDIGDTFRQCGLTAYIAPVKDRANLHVLTGATVTRILFEDKTATGVRFTYRDRSYSVKSKKEVIVSAGAIKSPQLLMISGIGPEEHLKSRGIEVVADLPVGQNLQDHPSVVMIFTLENDTSPPPAADPRDFPSPITCNYANLDNDTADFAQCQGINLVIPQRSPGLMAICLNAFKYKVAICQKWYDANVGKKVLFSYNTLYSPVSRGSILLRTNNINDAPVVNIGYLSAAEDVEGIGRCLANTARLVNTTYFKDIGGEFVDLDLCLQHEKFSAEYWRCYGVAMSTLSWHFSGTAAMGAVLDSDLLVRGVRGLRVVDASAIPVIPNAKLIAAVYVLAEKAADMIRLKNE